MAAPSDGEADSLDEENLYNKNKRTALVCSLAVEYLTFVAASGQSEASVEMRYEGENVWLMT